MEPKDVLHHYLDRERVNLLSRLEGLPERQVRWPMTTTGTNLLGLVKHVASVELGYFGEVVGRPSGVALPWLDDDAEPNACAARLTTWACSPGPGAGRRTASSSSTRALRRPPTHPARCSASSPRR